jgi:hypothetical protein
MPWATLAATTDSMRGSSTACQSARRANRPLAPPREAAGSTPKKCWTSGTPASSTSSAAGTWPIARRPRSAAALLIPAMSERVSPSYSLIICAPRSIAACTIVVGLTGSASRIELGHSRGGRAMNGPHATTRGPGQDAVGEQSAGARHRARVAVARFQDCGHAVHQVEQAEQPGQAQRVVRRQVLV